MPKELICPTCHVSLDERELVTNTWTSQSCPHCRSLIRKEEKFRWMDLEAVVRQDRAAIEEWLTAVVNGKPMGWSRQPSEDHLARDVWEVVGVELAGRPPWTCTIEYTSEVPGVFEMRLTTTDHGDVILGDPELLRAACTEQGVQPHAVHSSGADIWGGQRDEVRWGARQFLAAAQLTERLFWAVLGRLQHAMDAFLAKQPPKNGADWTPRATSAARLEPE